MQICKLAWRVNYMLIFWAIGTHWQSFRPKFCKIKVVWRFIHKILAKYCQKLILMSMFCQFSSLTSSIYWQIQYNTKKLKTSIFWKPYVWFPSNKNYMISVLSLTWWIYSNDPTVSFYFPEISFRTSLRTMDIIFLPHLPMFTYRVSKDTANINKVRSCEFNDTY